MVVVEAEEEQIAVPAVDGDLEVQAKGMRSLAVVEVVIAAEQAGEAVPYMRP